MPDQLMMTIAAALTAKGAEALAAGGANALGALYRAVRDRFGSGTRESETLRAAVERPGAEDRRVELADTLGRLMAEDPAFRTTVLAHWQVLRGDIDADHGGVVNTFSGTADKVLQARDIRGDVTL